MEFVIIAVVFLLTFLVAMAHAAYVEFLNENLLLYITGVVVTFCVALTASMFALKEDVTLSGALVIAVLSCVWPPVISMLAVVGCFVLCAFSLEWVFERTIGKVDFERVIFKSKKPEEK